MTAVNLLTQRSLGTAAAEHLVAAAIEGAQDTGVRVSIAVVDHGGHLVAFRRMDGAYPGSVDAAIGKARSCAGFRTSLKEFGRMARREPWLGELPGLIPLGGAVPVLADGEFVGAVSVSGSTEDNEQDLAERAARSFQ